jgi:hypothetical protein
VRTGTLRTLLIALLAAIAAILWFRWQARAPEPPLPAGTPPSQTPGRGPNVEPVVPGTPQGPAGSSSGTVPESDPGDLASAWESVDLEQIRRVMPDNTYWRMSAPTDDERVIREREEERARWNEAYGKVLSGTASVEEIQAYYAHRERLSADYVEFVSYLLDHHAGDLSDQDIGLLELARRLHLARLAGYPKETQRALDLKDEKDAARAAWLAGEAEFGGEPPPP